VTATTRATHPPFVRRVLRSPTLHFTAIGAVLALMHPWITRQHGTAGVARPPIVISAEHSRYLEKAFGEHWGRMPTSAERNALLEQAALDEMLYREARVLALELDDPSVRRRLVELARAVSDRPGRSDDELVQEALQVGFGDDEVIHRLLIEKMRLVLQRDPAGLVIGDAELVAYLESHRAEFVRPESITLTQLLVSHEQHGDAAADDAERLVQGLRSGALTLERAAELADPEPLGRTLKSYSRLQLQGRFGKSFADAVFELAQGTWSGPIESPFGLHVVRVEEKTSGRVPPLDEVRGAVLQAVRRQHARDNLARGLDRLRNLYEVRFADPSLMTDAGVRDARTAHALD